MKILQKLMLDISKPLEFAINPDENAVFAQQYTGDDFLKIMEGLKSLSRETVVITVLEQLKTKLTALIDDTFGSVNDSIGILDITYRAPSHALYHSLHQVSESPVYLDYFKTKMSGKTGTIYTVNNIDVAYKLLDTAVKSLGNLNRGYLSSLVHFMENDVESLLLPTILFNKNPITTHKVVVMGDDPELLTNIGELNDKLISSRYDDKGYNFDKINANLLKLADMVRVKFLDAVTKITSGSCTLEEYKSEMKYLEILIGGMGMLDEHIDANIINMRMCIMNGRIHNNIANEQLHEFVSNGIPERIRSKYGC